MLGAYVLFVLSLTGSTVRVLGQDDLVLTCPQKWELKKPVTLYCEVIKSSITSKCATALNNTFFKQKSTPRCTVGPSNYSSCNFGTPSSTSCGCRQNVTHYTFVYYISEVGEGDRGDWDCTKACNPAVGLDNPLTKQINAFCTGVSIEEHCSEKNTAHWLIFLAILFVALPFAVFILVYKVPLSEHQRLWVLLVLVSILLVTAAILIVLSISYLWKNLGVTGLVLIGLSLVVLVVLYFIAVIFFVWKDPPSTDTWQWKVLVILLVLAVVLAVILLFVGTFFANLSLTALGLIDVGLVVLLVSFLLAVIFFIWKGPPSKNTWQWKALVILLMLAVVFAVILIAVGIFFANLSLTALWLIEVALVVLVSEFIFAVIFFVWKDQSSKDTCQWKALVVLLMLAVVLAVILLAVGIFFANLSLTALVLIEVGLWVLPVPYFLAVIFFIWKDPPSKDTRRWKVLVILFMLLVVLAVILLAVGTYFADLSLTALWLIEVALVVLVSEFIVAGIFFVWKDQPSKDTWQWKVLVVLLTSAVVFAVILLAVGIPFANPPSKNTWQWTVLVILLMLGVLLAMILLAVGTSFANLSLTALVLIEVGLVVLLAAFFLAVFFFIWKDPQSKDTWQRKYLVILWMLAVVLAMILLAVGISFASLSLTVLWLIEAALVVLVLALIVAGIFFVWKDPPPKYTCQWIVLVVLLSLAVVVEVILLAVGIFFANLSLSALVLIDVGLVVLLVSFFLAGLFFIWKDLPSEDTCQWKASVVGLVLAVMMADIFIASGTFLEIPDSPGEDPCKDVRSAVIINSIMDISGVVIAAMFINIINIKRNTA